MASVSNYKSEVYPKQPKYDESCPLNTYYDTLPPTHKRIEYALGPRSVKHIYGSIGDFGYIKQQMPVNTLYGQQDVRYKAYPFTNRNVREIRQISNYYLTSPDIRQWTTYPVISDCQYGPQQENKDGYANLEFRRN